MYIITPPPVLIYWKHCTCYIYIKYVGISQEKPFNVTALSRGKKQKYAYSEHGKRKKRKTC